MKIRNSFVGATLLVAAIGSSALSLGRARGNAVLGQPLDISFDLRLDSADESSAPCVAVDILHGDTRVDPGRTRVSVEPTGQPQEVVVRIRSSVVVNEPLVSVILTAGCAQNTTRRYEFLSDFPLESRATIPPMNASQAPAPAAVVVAPAPAPAEVRPAPVAPPPQVETPPPAAVRTAPPVVRAPRPAAAPTAPKTPAAVPVPRKAEAEPARPRLKLEAPQVLPERDAALKSSTELKVAPAADNSPQRAEAAALWRALNTDPQERMAEAKRLQDLEAANKALREQTARNEARLLELQARMQKMEEERFGNGLLYGLAALLALALLFIAYLLLKRREAAADAPPQWWRNREMAEEEGTNAGAASSIPVSITSQAVAKPELAEVDVDLRDSDSAFAAFGGNPANVPVAPAPAPAVPRAAVPAVRPKVAPRGARNSINPEELFDIQQHAEFFVSLGQYDQAIDVLRKHIRDNPESSPLAYLDLLKIHHTLSRPEEYNTLRSEFNRIFNGRIPSFTSFSSEGGLLEDYPEVLGDIQTLWPAPQVVELIEEYMFPAPAGQGGAAFDLAAFRELMLLHAIAKSVVQPSGGDAETEEAAGRLAQARKNRLSSTAPISDFSHSDLSSVSAVLSSQAVELFSPTGDPLPDRLSSSYDREPTKSPLDLDLDLDLTEVEVHAPAAGPAAISSVDLEFPEVDLPGDTQPPPARPATGDKGNLIDFDLFDPNIEADIKPKVTRH